MLLLASKGVMEFVEPSAALEVLEANGAEADFGAAKLAKHAWDRWIHEEGCMVVDDISLILVPLQASPFPQAVLARDPTIELAGQESGLSLLASPPSDEPVTFSTFRTIEHAEPVSEASRRILKQSSNATILTENASKRLSFLTEEASRRLLQEDDTSNKKLIPSAPCLLVLALACAGIVFSLRKRSLV